MMYIIAATFKGEHPTVTITHDEEDAETIFKHYERNGYKATMTTVREKSRVQNYSGPGGYMVMEY